MKSKIKQSIFAVLSCGLLFSACAEDERGQFPTDSTAPQQVSNPAVVNFPGGATITYQLPDESDLLYVKCIYQLSNGSTQEVRSSVFSNSLTVRGYGKSTSTTVKLVSVDRSRNESQPVEVEIHPEDSPIYALFESLDVNEDWGGFTIRWDNPLKEYIVLSVSLQNKQGVYENIETFYSSAQNALQAVRGLESVATNIAISVRDYDDNSTDTLKMTLTPWYETQLDKSKFVGMPTSAKFTLSVYSASSINCLWDGNLLNLSTAYMTWYYNIGTYQPYVDVYLGVKAKLSRLRFWGREDYYFRLHHPKYVRVFGTDDPAVGTNPESLDSEWTELSQPPYYESIRPSGADISVVAVAGSEDYEYAWAGEEILIPLDAPEVRYVRFKSLETWSGTLGFQLMELSFWGNPNE
ncbi:hypothetical protein FACS1894199_12590 [Bacteroidia bacterium]|nr:hypothetical protein FACS1894199_12590 [Bacteroidia bacterium]